MKKIFVISFLVACLLQGIRWGVLGLVDDREWASQGYYVQVGDVHEFDTEIAYGYPGGPVIDGTVFFHAVFGMAYGPSLVAFLAVWNGFLIACITACAYELRKNLLWVTAVCGLLSLDRLYLFATPPSAVAPLFVVLLCMLSLLIYEKRESVQRGVLFAWSLVLGMSVATRIDIGVLSGAFFVLVVLCVLPWQKVLAMLGAAVVVFAVFDPFMYFIPIRHLHDLFDKVHNFYSTKPPYHLSSSQIWDVSWLMLVSVCFGPAFMLLDKKYRSPFPPRFILFLFVFTVGLYVVFLTARYQAERYFMPIVFIWHIFLPLFLLALTPEIEFSFLKSPESKERARKIYQWGVPAVLIGYEFALFISALALSSGGYVVKKVW